MPTHNDRITLGQGIFAIVVLIILTIVVVSHSHVPTHVQPSELTTLTTQ